MKNLWEEKDGIFEVAPGSEINSTIHEAMSLAKTLRYVGASVTFAFNGVIVSVRGDSSPDLVYRDWSRAMSGYIGKKIGPFYTAFLTESQKADDARVEAENEERRQASQREYDAKAAAKKSSVMARLDQTPAMRFKNKRAWDDTVAKNRDGYGGGVMIYAEQWARLMELEISHGKRLEEITKATSFEADTEGITGFMYGCAVSILSQSWIYGEELRCWHNLKTQLRDEGEKANESGGVLNPALLSLG